MVRANSNSQFLVVFFIIPLLWHHAINYEYVQVTYFLYDSKIAHLTINNYIRQVMRESTVIVKYGFFSVFLPLLTDRNVMLIII